MVPAARQFLTEQYRDVYALRWVFVRRHPEHAEHLPSYLLWLLCHYLTTGMCNPRRRRMPASRPPKTDARSDRSVEEIAGVRR